MCIQSFVTTKIAEFHKYQPHGGLNHLLSAKKSKIEKKKIVSHTKLV